MAINLQKGQRVSLDNSMKLALVGLGWDTNRYDGGADFGELPENRGGSISGKYGFRKSSASAFSGGTGGQGVSGMQ